MAALFQTILLTLMYTVSCNNILSDVIRNMRIAENNVCSVADFKERILCDVPIENNFIPNNGTCEMTDGKQTRQYIHCVNGYLYESFEKHTDRVKRSKSAEDLVSLTTTGAGLGAAIGGPIGGAIGGAVGFLGCLIFCGDSEPVIIVNKPPSISCSPPQPSDEITAGPLQTSVEVTWSNPSYSDPDGDSVTLGGGKPPSGSQFEHGYHRIVYTATDTNGNMAVCDVAFRVIVNYCRESLYVRNGWAECDQGDKINGATCTFYCNDGYQLTSDSVSSKTCEGTTFSSGKVECEKKKCSVPEPPCNGNFTCTNDLYEFDSVCYPKCNKGYETELSRYLKCNGDTWEGTNTLLECEDAQPPEFVNCPTSVTRFTDRGSDKAKNMTWNELIVIDNSQQGESCGGTSTVKVNQVAGLPYGSDFPEGFHIVQYEATDGNGLKSTCSFYVIVETISCDPLVPTDKYLISRCPNGFSYGSSCQFTCFLSYILRGSDYVTCELDSSGRHGFWAWTNNTESFCEKLMCPELPAPVNGALACSTALGNQICTMACNEKYQTPLKAPSEFVCNDEQEWIQGIPPNCTKRRNPNISVMPGELVYFYSGDCNDAAVQEGIKNHFITVMKDLAYNRNWSNICPSFCNISNVEVTCGPTTGRRRREETLFGYIVKRSTNQITINFNLQMSWLSEGDYWYNDDNIVAVSQEIENITSNGEFNYNGISPTLAFTYSSIGCQDGSVPDYYTETCFGCSPGTYLSTDKCADCAKGSYQEEEYKSSCDLCPPGMSTERTGSTSLSDCIETCQPGTFSDTSVQPCSACPVGTFQPNAGATSCLKCPEGKFTKTIGSTQQTNCTDFDVLLPANTELELKPLTKTSDDFGIGFWIWFSEVRRIMLTIKLNGFMFEIGTTLTVSHSGSTAVATAHLLPRTWSHIVLTWTQSTHEITVNVDEKNVMSEGFSAVDGSISHGSQLIIQSVNKITVSGMILMGSATAETYTRTCSPSTSNAFYTMTDFIKVNNSAIEMTESQCDEIDECLANPCGEGNGCTNKRNTYECSCLGGFTGSNCEIPPNFCLAHNCSNGATCQSLDTNYTCNCAPGFKGPFCQTAIVNGGWSSWLEWSECSKSCDGGTKTRVRFCDNPPPDTDGIICAGSNTDTTICNAESCPKCPPYYSIYQYKNEFTCNESSDYISCSVSCQDGYVFLNEYSPLDKYECGQNTSYQWKSKPPPCALIDTPISLRTSIRAVYDTATCTDAEMVKTGMKTKVQDLQCVQRSTCQATVETNGCGVGRRRRRSTANLEIIVTLISTLSESDSLDLEAFYASKIVSPALAEVIDAYTDIVLSTQIFFNDTDFYTIDANGQVYTTNFSNVYLSSAVECSPGKVEYQALCVPCPTGTYWKNGFCVLCDIGSYQNETGQQNCESCPDGYTTSYRASRNLTDCSVLVQESSTISSTRSSTAENIQTSTVASVFSSSMQTPTTSSSLSSTTEIFPSSTESTSTSVTTLAGISSGTITTTRTEKQDDNSPDEAAVIIPVAVVLVLIGAIAILSILLLKYRGKLRLQTRNKLSSSIASLNMVHPNLSSKTDLNYPDLPAKPDTYSTPPTNHVLQLDKSMC